MKGILENDISTLIKRVIVLIDSGDPSQLLEFTENLHSMDILEVLQELDDEYRDKWFTILPLEDACEVLESIDTETFDELLKLLPLQKKVSILEQMGRDDVVDHLIELDPERRDEIIGYFHNDDADDLRELMVYDEDTAGGIMTNEFLTLNEDFTSEESINYLREFGPEAESVYYLYVVDDQDHLRGVISLRDLIIANPDEKIKNAMNPNAIHVAVSDDQEEVAKVVSKYDLLAVPVLDEFDVLLGIITVDDIIDVIEEEATEDLLKFAGATGDYEDLEEDSMILRIRNSIQSRLPWLIITLFGGLLSASIIANYESALSGNAKIAMFIPILAGMGGNVGTQSSTLTVRSIAIGNIYGKEAIKTVIHEITVGLMVGLFCGVLAGVISIFLKNIDYSLAVIVALSMWANMLTAATIGTVVPLIFKKIGVDPAVASAPFITTTVDITGLTIYFTLVMVLSEKFM